MQKIFFVISIILIIQLISCIKDDVIDYDVLVELKFFKDNKNISNQYKIDSIFVHTSCFIPRRANPIKHSDTSLIYSLSYCCHGDFALMRISKNNYSNVIDTFQIEINHLDSVYNGPCEIIDASSITSSSEVSFADKKITVSISE